MRPISVLSSDARLEEGLRAAGLKTVRLDPVGLTELARAANGPTVLVVDVRGHQSLPVGLPAFRKQHAATGVVLVASTLEPRLMLEAMRAGVNECIQEPITAQALVETVRRLLVDAASEELGEIFSFVGAKGGVGTTTLAVNTATTLARAGGAALLIDLHIGQGDAGLFLAVEPRFSVIDAFENVHRVDESFFRGLVEKTKAGIDLLGSSDRLPNVAIDPQRVRALLDFAVRQYRYTVLDVPRTDPAMLGSLEAASRIVLVTSQELTALRSAGRLAQALRARYGGARVKAVVNRFDARGEIAHADIERVIGDSVTHWIPSDYRVAVGALNTGRPVVLERSRLAESFRGLARDLGGITKQPPERPAGVLGRLAFKRA